MRLGISYRTHSLPWTSDTSGAHVTRAALMMLSHQVEEGHSCPLTMTFAADIGAESVSTEMQTTSNTHRITFSIPLTITNGNRPALSYSESLIVSTQSSHTLV